MSNKVTFPGAEISRITFSSDPPSIALQHKDQKYWLFTGGDNGRDLTHGLLLYEELRNSSIVTVYDSGSDANGYNILSSISLHSGGSAQIEAERFERIFDVITIILLLSIVWILLRHTFYHQKTSEQSGPDNPRPFETPDTVDAKASAPPEASGGI